MPLPRDGYILLRGALDPGRVEAFSNCISTDMKLVQYRDLLQLLQVHVMPLAATSIEFVSPLVPTKVRVSASAGINRSNAADASTMHRDLVALDRGTLSPALTVLLYLDPATLELVPGSHLTPQLSMLQLPRLPRTKLSLLPGDIIVMAAQILHRGIFAADSGSSRRLVQCFECLPQPDPTTLHLPAHVSERSAAVHQAPILRSIASAFGLFNSGTGYGAPHPSLLRRGFRFMSSEGARPRLSDHAHADPGWLPINAYVYVSPPICDVHGGVRALAWSFYGRQYLTLSLLLKLASLLAVLLVFLFISPS